MHACHLPKWSFACSLTAYAAVDRYRATDRGLRTLFYSCKVWAWLYSFLQVVGEELTPGGLMELQQHRYIFLNK